MTSPVDLILVSAGRSSRMGFPKALARLNGTPLLERHFEISSSAGINEIILVVGFHEARLVHEICRLRLRERYPLRLVRNPDPYGDMFSSVKKGLEHQSGLHSVFFLPVDIPVSSSKTFQKLLDVETADSVIVPTFEGKRGHPPLFQPDFNEMLRNSSPSGGIRSLYQNEVVSICEVPVDDPSVLFDLDTPEDLRNFRSQVQNSAKLSL